MSMVMDTLIATENIPTVTVIPTHLIKVVIITISILQTKIVTEVIFNPQISKATLKATATTTHKRRVSIKKSTYIIRKHQFSKSDIIILIIVLKYYKIHFATACFENIHVIHEIPIFFVIGCTVLNIEYIFQECRI